ncbi:hypothetical protein PTSG_10386 [Salpingoeca rosetta]|uniref:Uncharacterized protein n=1 Tax=Salpingoeca rosetta (strain ATCC 50818 / BSB-021) TaxID=946362 RepID=F2UR57_SALR5|nr:uncharacterized protein PTSG_10386 [Salpingoeca rosetta]EGD80112.1 hypothetical protein PTSG_10386 [Salpingoeca rosetta]|eukprot:XP_004988437.1 hypothetical protein PTSG_10386 [Salpingoeca rosetta]
MASVLLAQRRCCHGTSAGNQRRVWTFTMAVLLAMCLVSASVLAAPVVRDDDDDAVAGRLDDALERLRQLTETKIDGADKQSRSPPRLRDAAKHRSARGDEQAYEKQDEEDGYGDDGAGADAGAGGRGDRQRDGAGAASSSFHRPGRSRNSKPSSRRRAGVLDGAADDDDDAADSTAQRRGRGDGDGDGGGGDTRDGELHHAHGHGHVLSSEERAEQLRQRSAETRWHLRRRVFSDISAFEHMYAKEEEEGRQQRIPLPTPDHEAVFLRDHASARELDRQRQDEDERLRAAAERVGQDPDLVYINPYDYLRSILAGDTSDDAFATSTVPTAAVREALETMETTYHLPRSILAALTRQLLQHARDGTVVEVGTGQVARALAEEHGVSIVTIIPSSFARAYLWSIRHLAAAVRPIVCVQDDIAAFITDAVDNPQMHVSAIAVSNLDLFTETHLPHELELLLGHALLLSPRLLLPPASTPDGLSFLSYWSSRHQLLARAMRLAHVTSSIMDVGGGVLETQLTRGVRRLAAGVCAYILRIFRPHLQDDWDDVDAVSCHIARTSNPAEPTVLTVREHMDAHERTTQSRSNKKQQPLQQGNGEEEEDTAEAEEEDDDYIMMMGGVQSQRDDDDVSIGHLVRITPPMPEKKSDQQQQQQEQEQQQDSEVGAGGGDSNADNGDGEYGDGGDGNGAAEQSTGNRNADSNANSNADSDKSSASASSTSQPPTPSRPLVLRIPLYQIPYLPVHTLVEMGMEGTSKAALFRVLSLVLPASIILQDLDPLGHPNGVVAVASVGPVFVDIPHTSFAFRGTVWSQVAAASAAAGMHTPGRGGGGGGGGTHRDGAHGDGGDGGGGHIAGGGGGGGGGGGLAGWMRGGSVDYEYEGAANVEFVDSADMTALLELQNKDGADGGDGTADDAGAQTQQGSDSSDNDQQLQAQQEQQQQQQQQRPWQQAFGAGKDGGGDGVAAADDDEDDDPQAALRAMRRRLIERGLKRGNKIRDGRADDDDDAPPLRNANAGADGGEDGDEYDEYQHSRHGRQLLVSDSGLTSHGHVQKRYDAFWTLIRDSMKRIARTSAVSAFDADARAGHARQQNALPFAHEAFNIQVYGRVMSLLGVKVARFWSNSTVVAIVPTVDSAPFFSRVMSMVHSLRLSNTHVVPAHLDGATVLSLSSVPQAFKFQFLGREVFEQIPVLDKSYPAYLGRLLAMAEHTYLEPVDPQVLLACMAALSAEEVTTLKGQLQGLVRVSLEAVGITEFQINFLTDRSRAPTANPEHVLIHVQLLQAQRQVHACKQPPFTLHMGETVTLSKEKQESAGRVAVPRAHHTVSLSYMLALPIRPATRARLFAAMLAGTVQSDVCPINFVLDGHGLRYCSLTQDCPHSTKRKQESAMEESAFDVDGLLQVLRDQLDMPFSFVEWGSGAGNISTAVAATWPNSTVLSFESSNEEAHRHWSEIKRRKAFNNIVGRMPTDRSTMLKFYKSPEFFRYQFVSWRHLRDLWSQSSSQYLSRSEYGRTFGIMIANAVTTFVQLPSPAIVSAALMVFYPNLRGVYTGDDITYSLDDHPSPHFSMGVQQSIVDGLVMHEETSVRIASSVVVAPPSDAGKYSWTLVRIDLRNSSHQVDHHFEYQLDGHQRKYQQHCVSTTRSDWRVYLVRDKDKFRIPYETVDAVTLIALLRLNLLSEIKNRFYDLLLGMGVYEDMAPWNIAFRSGRLVYIDYDTKDIDLTKLVPMAYQVMAALMNLERTVKDFGHCPGHARNNYNIPFVSHCVRSQYQGPCEDDRYPVPCGDRTCRESYLQCLQAIHDLDVKHERMREREAALGLLSGGGSRSSSSSSSSLLSAANQALRGPAMGSELNIIYNEDGASLSTPEPLE